jgi:hypothetical protein
MASSTISGKHVLEAMDQGISNITTRMAEMDQITEKFGGWRDCFDSG